MSSTGTGAAGEENDDRGDEDVDELDDKMPDAQ
jgi:hypothetical protein